MKRILATLGLAVLACNEPTPPSRGGTYNFADTIPPDTIIVFHWPSSRVPVRFYAVPTGNTRFLTQRAVDVWAGLFLYREFEGQLVSDSTAADVILLADSAPDVPPDTGVWVYACTGETDPPPYTAPIHIQPSPSGCSWEMLSSPSPCFARTRVKRSFVFWTSASRINR